MVGAAISGIREGIKRTPTSAGPLQALCAATHRDPFLLSALIVTAHPDDETVGVGSRFPLLRNARMLTLTDGAPRDECDATRAGCASWPEYAALRRSERDAALAEAGWNSADCVDLMIPDQRAMEHLSYIATVIVALCLDDPVEIIVTHAYEGGHPDHDSAAAAVAMAREALTARDVHPPRLMEFASYHLALGKMRTGKFAPGSPRGKRVLMDPSTLVVKERMLRHYASQSRMLAAFDPGVERLRWSPGYDFSALPNGGELWYEGQPWGISGEDWLSHARAAWQTSTANALS